MDSPGPILPIATSMAAPVDDATRLVREIIAQAKVNSAGLALPPLKYDEDSTGPGLWDHFREMIQRLTDWLVSFLPKPSQGAVDSFGTIIELFLELFLVVGAALLLASLVFWIYRALQPRARHSASVHSWGPKLQIASDQLDEDLRLALRSGDFPKASRLRWRLFLQRTQTAAAITPREYFARDRAKIQVENQAYDLMFRKSRELARASDYQSLDQTLSQFERSALAP